MKCISYLPLNLDEYFTSHEASDEQFSDHYHTSSDLSIHIHFSFQTELSPQKSVHFAF